MLASAMPTLAFCIDDKMLNVTFQLLMEALASEK